MDRRRLLIWRVVNSDHESKIHDLIVWVRIMGDCQENTNKIAKNTKENEERMPTIEKVNYEMTGYLRDIEKYIEKFKSLPEPEARKQAKENLMGAGIIDEQGDLTGFYKNP